jgi:hypothetical protein
MNAFTLLGVQIIIIFPRATRELAHSNGCVRFLKSVLAEGLTKAKRELNVVGYSGEEGRTVGEL